MDLCNFYRIWGNKNAVIQDWVDLGYGDNETEFVDNFINWIEVNSLTDIVMPM